MDYSTKDIDLVGRTLVSSKDETCLNEALEIVNNLRVAYELPLNIFRVYIKKYSEFIDNKSIIVLRLKKLNL